MPSSTALGRSIFGKYLNVHLKFTVYGRKQASRYVNTLPQCSPASVGLTQARPNEGAVAHELFKYQDSFGAAPCYQ